MATPRARCPLAHSVAARWFVVRPNREAMLATRFGGARSTQRVEVFAIDVHICFVLIEVLCRFDTI